MAGFAVGGIIWDLFWWGKCLKIGSIGGWWCQVSDGILGCLRVIEELKSPCRYRGFLG